jgi:threonine dehydrogenase-like Zn-dependent dehydrogenase
MNVTVFGIGYVGLVQAAVLADAGHEVCCVDVDATKVENLKAGIIPIFEPGLSALVQKNHDAGRLHFTTDAAQGVRHGEVQFIAVGTPEGDDLAFVDFHLGQRQGRIKGLGIADHMVRRQHQQDRIVPIRQRRQGCCRNRRGGVAGGRLKEDFLRNHVQ